MPTRHYRIGHYAESADVGSDLIVPHHNWEPWDCFCGAVITDGAAFCPVCSSERGDWMCGCGHKNRKRSRDCEVCGLPRPEDADG